MRRKSPMADRAISLYRRLVELHDDLTTDQREEGRRREYLDLQIELHAALDRKPWQTAIMDTFGDDAAPQWMVMQQPERIEDWRQACAIRVALDDATS